MITDQLKKKRKTLEAINVAYKILNIIIYSMFPNNLNGLILNDILCS